MKKNSLYKYLFFALVAVLIGFYLVTLVGNNANNVEREMRQDVLDAIASEENEATKDVVAVKGEPTSRTANTDLNIVAYEKKIAKIAECREFKVSSYEQQFCLTDVAYELRDKTVCEVILNEQGEKDFFEIDLCVQEYKYRSVANELNLDYNYFESDEVTEEIFNCIDFSEEAVEEMACITGVAIRNKDKNICLNVTDINGNIDFNGVKECLANFSYQKTIPE